MVFTAQLIAFSTGWSSSIAAGGAGPAAIAAPSFSSASPPARAPDCGLAVGVRCAAGDEAALPTPSHGPRGVRFPPADSRTCPAENSSQSDRRNAGTPGRRDQHQG